jgi:hypothetical protein
MQNGNNRNAHHNPMAECLTGQAHICDRIASECWNEEMAITFEGLARDCNDAAAVTRAEWPAIRAFCKS